MKDFGFLQNPYETTTTSSTPIGRPREILHSSTEVPYRAGSIGGALAGNRSKNVRRKENHGTFEINHKFQKGPANLKKVFISEIHPSLHFTFYRTPVLRRPNLLLFARVGHPLKALIFICT
ncbi:predicted protein [Coccidioides posadasii str. Silveira]|uniref:Predicted protein n=1 Tax=Coccidioides posadasii (strain RMSCC 757 / Silveira) TaxID=443226 RepID=E9DE95_COCPS|nr:predicted protein [Coccidioides posadasii str. Silveira]